MPTDNDREETEQTTLSQLYVMGQIYLKHDELSIVVFFFKQKTAYEIGVRLVGSEMCIRDRTTGVSLCSPG